jgi:lysozyme family protein
MTVNIQQLKALNAQRWNKGQIVPVFDKMLDQVAARLTTPVAKSRYTLVSAQTTVPWFVVAVIHERESSQSWLASLAQGDPWNRVSIHVPVGIGPFDTWEDAAVFALRSCAPFASKWQDWTSGGLFTLLEEYNGLGYAARGMPSPYVWACTDQYTKGKYVADGHFDPEAIDHQMGCAALLSRMINMDSSIVIKEYAQGV